MTQLPIVLKINPNQPIISQLTQERLLAVQRVNQEKLDYDKVNDACLPIKLYNRRVYDCDERICVITGTSINEHVPRRVYHDFCKEIAAKINTELT